METWEIMPSSLTSISSIKAKPISEVGLSQEGTEEVPLSLVAMTKTAPPVIALNPSGAEEETLEDLIEAVGVELVAEVDSVEAEEAVVDMKEEETKFNPTIKFMYLAFLAT